MEEISHVFLGHQPSRLKVLATNKSGRSVARDYRAADEEAAYATGAAALGAMIIAASLAFGRAGAWPRWASWLGVLVGILAIAAIAFFTQFLFLLWVLIVSLVLFFRPAVGTPLAG